MLNALWGQALKFELLANGKINNKPIDLKKGS
jgi:hypothetical protein